MVLSLVHQLAMSVEKRWRRLRGFRHLADVIADVRFINGVNEKGTERRTAGFRTLDSGWPYARFDFNSSRAPWWL